MDHILLLKFVLLAVFLGCSAFFSASETALFSLDTIKLKRLSQGGRDTSFIVRLLENPIRCLTTILAGNTLVNIVVAVLVTSILMHFFGDRGVAVSIAVTTIILLLFGEVTPKTVAIHNNERLSRLLAPPLYFFSRLITPFLFAATQLCDGIISFFHLNLRKEPTLTEEEFRTVMEVGHRHGVVAKSEKEMVVSILELTTTTAQEIMTPRTDLKCLSVSWDLSRARAYARETKHSKFPVYKGSFDNILGVVYATDLFLEDVRPWTECVRPTIFIPPTKKISELIKDLYRQESKMAIVVDEYGGTNGLVTLQDVLKEIFGELEDEFQAKESLIELLPDGTCRVSGKAPIYKVNEDCLLSVPSGDYETIAGFILDRFGRIPSEGESIEAHGALFSVERVAGRRVKSILIKKQ